MKTLSVRFYVLPSGRVPVREWLMEQPERDRKTIGFDIHTIQTEWPVGLPTCRAMGRGLWEVRSTLKDGRAARVLFALVGGDIVLLHAFIKTSQKCPPQDLDLAWRRLKEIE